MADPVVDLTVALVAVIDADATLTTLMGRATEKIVEWESVGVAPRPVIAFQWVDLSQDGASGDNRTGLLQLTCFAEGDSAGAVADAIIARVSAVLDSEVMWAQMVDFAPLWRRRVFVPTEREESRALRRADLEITFEVRH